MGYEKEPKPGQLVSCGYRSGHIGVVLRIDHPRAWAGTIAFPDRDPDQKAVTAHVERHWETLTTSGVPVKYPVEYPWGIQWDHDLTVITTCGYEASANECRARAEWERKVADSVQNQLYGEILAPAHRRTADAYEDRARDMDRTSDCR